MLHYDTNYHVDVLAHVQQAFNHFSRIVLKKSMPVLSVLKQTLLEIGFSEEMRTTCGNKDVPQPFFAIPLIRENTIKSVRLRTIGNPAFRNFMTSQKADFAVSRRF